MAVTNVLDVDMYYEAPRGIAAKPEELVLLLVHGFGGSARHFELLIPELPPYVRPIAVDLPGHGRSGGVAPASIELFSEYLAEFLRKIGVAQPICYFGHSLGGLLGLQFISKYSERSCGLVLVASAPRIRIHADLQQQTRSGCWDLDVFRRSFSAHLPEERQRIVLDDFPRLRVAVPTALETWSSLDLSSILPTIGVRVLVIVPEQDIIISPRKGRQMASEIPGAQLFTLPAAGHYVHIEQPRAAAKRLNSFLSELRRERTSCRPAIPL